MTGRLSTDPTATADQAARLLGEPARATTGLAATAAPAARSAADAQPTLAPGAVPRSTDRAATAAEAAACSRAARAASEARTALAPDEAAQYETADRPAAACRLALAAQFACSARFGPRLLRRRRLHEHACARVPLQGSPDFNFARWDRQFGGRLLLPVDNCGPVDNWRLGVGSGLVICRPLRSSRRLRIAGRVQIRGKPQLRRGRPRLRLSLGGLHRIPDNRLLLFRDGFGCRSRVRVRRSRRLRRLRVGGRRIRSNLFRTCFRLLTCSNVSTFSRHRSSRRVPTVRLRRRSKNGPGHHARLVAARLHHRGRLDPLRRATPVLARGRDPHGRGPRRLNRLDRLSRLDRLDRLSGRNRRDLGDGHLQRGAVGRRGRPRFAAVQTNRLVRLPTRGSTRN